MDAEHKNNEVPDIYPSPFWAGIQLQTAPILLPWCPNQPPAVSPVTSTMLSTLSNWHSRTDTLPWLSIVQPVKSKVPDLTLRTFPTSVSGGPKGTLGLSVFAPPCTGHVSQTRQAAALLRHLMCPLLCTLSSCCALHLERSPAPLSISPRPWNHAQLHSHHRQEGSDSPGRPLGPLTLSPSPPGPSGHRCHGTASRLKRLCTPMGERTGRGRVGAWVTKPSMPLSLLSFLLSFLPSFLLSFLPFFLLSFLSFSSPEDIFSLLLEREEGREKGRERNINLRKKHRLFASHTHQDGESYSPGLGIKPTTFW